MHDSVRRLRPYLFLLSFGVLLPACEWVRLPPKEAPNTLIDEMEFDLIEADTVTSQCETVSSAQWSLDQLRIFDTWVVGFDDGEQTSEVPAGLVQVSRYFDSAFSYSDCVGVDSGAVEGDWTANTGIWNGCDFAADLACGPYDDCSGYYEASIAMTGSSFTCDQFYPMKLRMEVEDDGSGRAATSLSTCSAGAGTFGFLPFRYGDLDNDGDGSLVMLPIQYTGTGSLTGAAWITKIQVIEDDGATLRAIKVNQPIRFEHTDHLVSPATVSVAVTGTHNFETGVIGGNVPFVVENIDGDTPFGPAVEMTWSCAAAGTVGRPKGYRFKLEDIGCSAKQQIVIRPIGGTVLQWELYGNPNYRHRVPLTSLAGGVKAFTIEVAGLDLEGRLLSWNNSQAVVVVDSLKVGGEDECTPGQYTFTAE